jgi:hypothetical protein
MAERTIAAEIASIQEEAEANAEAMYWRMKYEHEVTQHVRTLTDERQDTSEAFRCGFLAAVAVVGVPLLTIEIIRLLM